MIAEITQHAFTVHDYHQMAEAGILTENDRVELLDGQIYTMSPIGRKHAACVKRLNKLLVSRLGDAAIVGVQDPVRLNDLSEPEPDVALLLARDDFYEGSIPTAADVLLIIEVSEATLRFDREVKLPLYAQSGILEVWIIDLKKALIEVYTDPQDGVYGQKKTFKREQSLVPSQVQSLSVNVTELLG